MAINPNPRSSNYRMPDFSVNRDRSTFAYRMDILPAAQHRLANSIAEPTGSAVDKIKQLEAYYFYYNELGNDWGFDQPGIDYPEILDENVYANGKPKRLGLIAQELQAVEPSLVRPMTWLGADAAGEGQDYYWIDYDALYILCLDAINELNARAEAAKAALGITPAETYPARPTSTTTSTPPSNWNLTVTPTTGPEGSQSVWTLTADGVADGTIVGFKLDGSCNFKDITCSDPNVKLLTYSEEEVWGTDENGEVIWEDYDPTEQGWAAGIFTFSGGQAQVTLDYVLDDEIEGPETIIMTLRSPSSSRHNVTPVSATATITDV